MNQDEPQPDEQLKPDAPENEPAPAPNLEPPTEAEAGGPAAAPFFDDEVSPSERGLGLLRDFVDRSPEDEPEEAGAPVEAPGSMPESFVEQELIEETGIEEGSSPGADEGPPEAEVTALIPASTTTVATTGAGRPGAEDGPPGRPPVARGGGWFGEKGPRRTLTILVVVFASAVAAYVGIAVGDSIQGGGSISATPGPLPTRPPGVRQVACGTAPIAMDQSTRADIAFDSGALPNFHVVEVAVRSMSAGASLQAVAATAQQDLSVLFEAFPAAGSPGRVDEYELAVTFARGEERTVAQCRILVTAPASTATPTPVATATQTPTPAPSATPLVLATAPLPPPPTATSTPEPPSPTPEPSTATPTPTAPASTSTATVTGTPATSTPTATGTPPTATPTP